MKLTENWNEIKQKMKGNEIIMKWKNEIKWKLKWKKRNKMKISVFIVRGLLPVKLTSKRVRKGLFRPNANVYVPSSRSSSKVLKGSLFLFVMIQDKTDAE
jgi:hypothetical protein